MGGWVGPTATKELPDDRQRVGSARGGGSGGGFRMPSLAALTQPGAAVTPANAYTLPGPSGQAGATSSTAAADAKAALAAGTPGVAGTPGAAGPTLNTAEADPNLSQFQADVKARLRALQAKEGKDPLLMEQVEELRKRKSTDTTQRAIDVAAQDTGARARAAGAALREQLARRGIRPDSGVAAELQSRISRDASREKAGSAARIALGRERDLDALTLGGTAIMGAPGQHEIQREGMSNAVLGLSGEAAGRLASQGLGDRELGLRQWQTTVDASQRAKEAAARQEEARLAQLLAFTRLGMEAQQYAR